MLQEYDEIFHELIRKLQNFLFHPSNSPHFSEIKIHIRNALIFHSFLTIEELHEITSIPIGTLYQNIIDMMEADTVQRDSSPNSRKFSYRLRENADILGYSLSQQKNVERENRIQLLMDFLSQLNDELSSYNSSDMFFVNQVKEYTFYCIFEKYYHNIKTKMKLPDLTPLEEDLLKSLEYEYDSNSIVFPIDMIEFSPSIQKAEETFISKIVIPGFEKEIPQNLELVLSRFHSRKILSFPKLLQLSGLSKSSLSQALKSLCEKTTIQKIPGNDTNTNRPLYFIPSLPKDLIEVTANRAEYLRDQLNEFRRVKNDFAKNWNKMQQKAGFYRLYSILDTICTLYFPYWELIGEYCSLFKSLMVKKH